MSDYEWKTVQSKRKKSRRKRVPLFLQEKDSGFDPGLIELEALHSGTGVARKTLIEPELCALKMQRAHRLLRIIKHIVNCTPRYHQMSKSLDEVARIISHSWNLLYPDQAVYAHIRHLALALGSIEKNKNTLPQLCFFLSLRNQLAMRLQSFITASTDVGDRCPHQWHTDDLAQAYDPDSTSMDQFVLSQCGLHSRLNHHYFRDESKNKVEPSVYVIFAPHAPLQLTIEIWNQLRIFRSSMNSIPQEPSAKENRLYSMLVWIGNPMICPTFDFEGAPLLKEHFIDIPLKILNPFEESPLALEDTCMSILRISHQISPPNEVSTPPLAFDETRVQSNMAALYKYCKWNGAGEFRV